MIEVTKSSPFASSAANCDKIELSKYQVMSLMQRRDEMGLLVSGVTVLTITCVLFVVVPFSICCNVDHSTTTLRNA
jgi:hypothetical protein